MIRTSHLKISAKNTLFLAFIFRGSLKSPLLSFFSLIYSQLLLYSPIFLYTYHINKEILRIQELIFNYTLFGTLTGRLIKSFSLQVFRISWIIWFQLKNDRGEPDNFKPFGNSLKGFYKKRRIFRSYVVLEIQVGLKIQFKNN